MGQAGSCGSRPSTRSIASTDAEAAAQRRGVASREVLVALGHDLVDRRDGGRRPEVVVQGIDEVRAQHAVRRHLTDRALGAVEERLDPAEGLGGLVERLEGELHVRAVVGRDHVVAQLDPAHPLEHRRDQHRVAQRLRHLLAGGGDPRVVQPVRRERLAGRARLGQLVLVVGEAEVDPAAVDVEGRTEVLRGHGGALDVPPRPARAVGRRPRRGLGLEGLLPALPQCEVARVALPPAGRRPRPAPCRRSSAGSARRRTATSARRSRRRPTRPRRRRRARAPRGARSARGSRGRARSQRARRSGAAR